MLKFLFLFWLIGLGHGFGHYHFKQYRQQHDSSEGDNSVARTYRRCMWEQSKFLPRRLVLLSLCQNLFCENNQASRPRSMFSMEKVTRPNDCLDILPEQCEQGEEEKLMYKPFPECCPVYCNLKRRMLRLRTMHIRHRHLVDVAQQPLGDYNLPNYAF